MIRINLLGQTRPKAARRPVDTGAAMPLVFIGAGVLLGGLFLFYFYHSWQTQLNEENGRIKQLTAQKTELEQIKLQVEAFRKAEAGAAAARGHNRTASERSHRRSGTAGPGRQHGVTRGEFVAHVDVQEGDSGDVSGCCGLHQFRGELYNRTEALGVFPEGRD